MSKNVLTTNLAPLMEELNTIYNGQAEGLQNALIKAGFYISMIRGRYGRDELRPVSDRLGRLSTCFITMPGSRMGEVEIKKLTHTISKDYSYNIEGVIKDIYFVIKHLSQVRNVQDILIRYTDIELFKYHLTNFLRALETCNKNGARNYKLYPSIQLEWYKFN
jgi:hypothetical protein